MSKEREDHERRCAEIAATGHWLSIPHREAASMHQDIDNLLQREAALKARCEALENVLRESMRGHHQCDDPWYSCPLNPEGCADERETECNCGASAWNAKVLACLAVADGADHG